ncbi:putative coiled-coil domain-containing protein 195 [Bufo gargarizans]|uniref:putative coiled-coil domain-containing protein 195 n=1 Tax=Bufo gargarizans TaxID=30331 RepID=UPI001CF5D4D3|nr:putative coiled-coil domain-containing protein 195 [Bufo gargarizans]
MEGDTHLLREIRELRSEIKKLEKENQELRGELSQVGHNTICDKERELRTGIRCDQAQKEEVMCKGLLRRNVSVQSADLLQEQTGTAMTVRRYSMSSLHSSSEHCKHSEHLKRRSSSETLPGPNQNQKSDTDLQLAKDEETAAEMLVVNIPKTRSFQQYMHKCRGRVKAVTFMLPMDMRDYGENQKTFQAPPNQSANHLSTIIEKDP